MPIYEYVCPNCMKEVDYWPEYDGDKPPRKCMFCGGKMQKKMSKPHVRVEVGMGSNFQQREANEILKACED